MITLAIESSTTHGSIALVDEQAESTHRDHWIDPKARHRDLAGRVAALLGDAGITWDEITLVVAGQGPGSYAGMRSGILTACFAAMPGNLPVRVVSSAEAIAREQLVQLEVDHISVIGDARRNHIWKGTLATGNDESKPVAWSLVPLDQLDHANLAPVIATPHLSEIQTILNNAGIKPETLIEAFPDAIWLARMASLQVQLEISPAPCQPLYLHPPV